MAISINLSVFSQYIIQQGQITTTSARDRKKERAEEGDGDKQKRNGAKQAATGSSGCDIL